MSAPRIYADFHNLDGLNRLRLTCAGTREDLARQRIELREGLRLDFYMDDAADSGEPDDILAEGVVHFDPVDQTWVADVDWLAVRHASEDKTRPVDANNGAASPAADNLCDIPPNART